MNRNIQNIEAPGAQQARRRWYDLYGYTLSHTTVYARVWQLIIALVGVSLSWGIPYFVAFANEDLSLGWTISDWCLSAVFMVDVVTNYSTSYIDEDTKQVVVDKELIKRHYGMWGFLDIFCVIPYRVFSLLINSPIVARLSLLLRLLYFRKTFKALSRLNEADLRGVETIVRWIKLLLATFFALHFMACGFFFFARENPDKQGTWLSLQVQEKPLLQYIVSFYWSTTSLSTVGYGDLHPVSVAEMIFTVVCIIFGVGLMVYLSTDLNKLLSGDDRPRHIIDYAKVLRRFGRTTQTLSVEFKNMMVKYSTKDDILTTSPLAIKQIFPKSIQRELYVRWISHHLQQLYFFHGVSEPFLFQMMAEMKIEEVDPDMPIALANELPEKFFIVLNGNLIWEQTAYHSHICGELGVLGNLPQPFTVQPTIRSSVLSLDRAAFLKLLEVNREDGTVMLRNVLELLQGHLDPSLRMFYERFEERLNRGKIDIPVDIDFALRRANPGLLLHLIKIGENFDHLYDDNQNILHVAVSNQEIEPRIVGTLLIHCPHLHTRDLLGKVPLAYAIEQRCNMFVNPETIFRSDRVLEQFLSGGVTLPQDMAKLFYFKASEENNLNLLKLFGKFGDVNMAITRDGDRPLHRSVERNDIGAVKILLSCGANPDQPNAGGETPRDVATLYGREEIIRCFGA